MVFHWSLSESKSLHVFRTFLSILADLNKAVVWMVSICPPISNPSIPLSKRLCNVLSAPTNISIPVMFPKYVSSLTQSKYLSLFSFYFLLFFLLLFFLGGGSVCISKFLYSLWVFYTTIGLRSFTWVWVTACLFKSSGLFLVSWSI